AADTAAECLPLPARSPHETAPLPAHSPAHPLGSVPRWEPFARASVRYSQFPRQPPAKTHPAIPPAVALTEALHSGPAVRGRRAVRVFPWAVSAVATALLWPQFCFEYFFVRLLRYCSMALLRGAGPVTQLPFR